MLTLDYGTCDHTLHNTKTWISLKWKKIFQKGKHQSHSSLLWNAFQIRSYYFLLHRHFKYGTYLIHSSFFVSRFEWGSQLSNVKGDSVLTLSPPRVSLWRVKSSGITQSKIYKWPLVVKGLNLVPRLECWLSDIWLQGTGLWKFTKIWWSKFWHSLVFLF